MLRRLGTPAVVAAWGLRTAAGGKRAPRKGKKAHPAPKTNTVKVSAADLERSLHAAFATDAASEPSDLSAATAPAGTAAPPSAGTATPSTAAVESILRADLARGDPDSEPESVLRPAPVAPGASILPTVTWAAVLQRLQLLAVEHTAAAAAQARKVRQEAIDFTLGCPVPNDALSTAAALECLHRCAVFGVAPTVPLVRACGAFVAEHFHTVTASQLTELFQVIQAHDTLPFWHKAVLHDVTAPASAASATLDDGARAGATAFGDAVGRLSLEQVMPIASAVAMRRQPAVMPLVQLTFDSALRCVRGCAVADLPPRATATFVRTFAPIALFGDRTTAALAACITRASTMPELVLCFGIATAAAVPDPAVAAALEGRLLALRAEWTPAAIAAIFGDTSGVAAPEITAGAAAEVAAFAREAIATAPVNVTSAVHEGLDVTTFCDALEALARPTALAAIDAHAPLAARAVELAAQPDATLHARTLLAKSLAVVRRHPEALTVAGECARSVAHASAAELCLLLNCWAACDAFPGRDVVAAVADQLLQRRHDCSIDDVAVAVYAFGRAGFREPAVLGALADRVARRAKFEKRQSEEGARELSPHSVALLLRGFQEADYGYRNDPRLFGMLAQRALTYRHQFPPADCCNLLVVASGMGPPGEPLRKALVGQLRATLPTVAPAALPAVAATFADLELRDVPLFRMLAARLAATAAILPRQDVWAVLRVYERVALLGSLEAPLLWDVLAPHLDDARPDPPTADHFARAALWLAETGAPAKRVAPLAARGAEAQSVEGLAALLLLRGEFLQAPMDDVPVRLAAAMRGAGGEGLGRLFPSEAICRCCAVALAAKPAPHPDLVQALARHLVTAAREDIEVGSMCNVLFAAAGARVRVDGLFRAFGKRIGAHSARLSAPEATKALVAYAVFNVADDYAVQALFGRCVELRGAIVKNEQLLRRVRRAQKTFGSWSKAL